MYFLFNGISLVFFLIEIMIGHFDKELSKKVLVKTSSKLAFVKFENGGSKA